VLPPLHFVRPRMYWRVEEKRSHISYETPKPLGDIPSGFFIISGAGGGRRAPADALGDAGSDLIHDLESIPELTPRMARSHPSRYASLPRVRPSSNSWSWTSKR